METYNKNTKNWLILAVAALAGAGLYSLPPVIFRGPVFKDILPVEKIFASSLVVHVDLSVLVWMLAMGGVFWSRFSEANNSAVEKIVFWAACLGTLLIAFSPFAGHLYPLKNNYIPVLQNPVFFVGLGLFASAIIIKALFAVAAFEKMVVNPIGYGVYVSAVVVAISAICFVIAAVKSPAFEGGDATSFYEYIFWGGGHILQVVYATLMVVAWYVLLDACGYKNILSNRAIYALFAVTLFTSLPAPFFYLSENATSIFASHMQLFMGITPLAAGIAVIYSVLSGKRAQNSARLLPFLILSVLLFGYGGVLGYMISGVNVTIPAHYHGSIVGITLGFMGIVIYYMPKVGFSAPRGIMAVMQPYVYGIGQAMHITGLAIMGGYGALRKDAASSQNIDTVLGKGLFFAGGSLAILGGLLFVIVVFMAMRRRA